MSDQATTTIPPPPAFRQDLAASPVSDLDKMLEQVHPHYASSKDRWTRYRAFLGTLDDKKVKTDFLPRGKHETEPQWQSRLEITHGLPLSRWAVRRMIGTLCKQAPRREYLPPAAESGGPGAFAQDDLPAGLDPGPALRVHEDLVKFDARCDKRGRSIDRWFQIAEREALGMGISFAFVDKDRRDAPPEGQAAPSPTRADDTLPFLELWKAEEVRNWDVDDTGVPLWAVLRRKTTQQPGPLLERKAVFLYKVLTRTTGTAYRREMGTDGKLKAAEQVGETWIHNVGMVPLVPIYAVPGDEEYQGESYIEDISRADWRVFQLESDQAMASHLTGNPQMVIKTKRDLAEISPGSSWALKLDPDPESPESAEFLAPDTGGLDLREAMIERTERKGLTMAGIDAGSAAIDGQGRQARSGVSLALQFNQAESPTLASLADELDLADRRIHEIAARYMLPDAAVHDPGDRVFLGTIERRKAWDLMDVGDLTGLASELWDLIRVPEWRKEMVKTLAALSLQNQPEEVRAKVQAAIDAWDFSAPKPPTAFLEAMQPPPEQPGADPDASA